LKLFSHLFLVFIDSRETVQQFHEWREYTGRSYVTLIGVHTGDVGQQLYALSGGRPVLGAHHIDSRFHVLHDCPLGPLDGVSSAAPGVYRGVVYAGPIPVSVTEFNN
jgi:hypothetical protein